MASSVVRNNVRKWLMGERRLRAALEDAAPGKMKGKLRRAWLKGTKAWRLRTKDSPSMYETEYLNTATSGRTTSTTPCTRSFGGLSESLSSCIKT
jgi:hypothetical protein